MEHYLNKVRLIPICAYLGVIADKKEFTIFEGFMDFLSFLEFKKGMEKSDYIIMNSSILIEKTIKAIQGPYDHVDLYLDNDKSGDEVTAKIILECGCNTEDKRVFYKGFNDLNSRLLAQ